MSIAFPELREVEGRIDALATKVRTALEEAGPEKDFAKVKSLGDGDTVTKVAELAKVSAELNELTEKHKNLTIIAKAAGYADDFDGFEQGDPAPTKARRQTLGQRFVKSAARLQRELKSELDADLSEIKTLMSRSAGWAPESIREAGYLPAATAPLMVVDLIPMLGTGQAAVKYMEQTTRTNNAAERAEGSTYGEAAFALTERSVTIETIGVWLPVTDEQLDDETEAQDMIDFELPFMTRQRLDSQILVGDGSTPNILGVNNKSGIQTQAKGSDATLDAIYKGRTKVRVTGRAMPHAVVIHPNDWQDIRLTRTADGIYILGNPDHAGPTQVWGLTVVESDNQTEGTAVVGDFNGYARLYMRRGIEVERTNAHDTFFINGKQAIRAGLRCATVWKRAAAFCTVTGI